MTNDLLQRSAQFRSRAVLVVGLTGIAITAGLVVVAWLFVVPAAIPQRIPAHASALENVLFEHANGGAEAEASGVRELGIVQWVDRDKHIVRIPLERAIDAVVANPRLIGGH